jgi:hypothetical protein
MNQMKFYEPLGGVWGVKMIFLRKTSENARIAKNILFFKGIFRVLRFILLHLVHKLEKTGICIVNMLKFMNLMNFYEVEVFNGKIWAYGILFNKFMNLEKGLTSQRFINQGKNET